MASYKPGERDRATTRGKVVELLRRGQSTVDELARALDLTDNAVRMHLAVLEREGIVTQIGVRRSGVAGKPAIIYEIPLSAEPLFSKAYPPILATLVEVLRGRLGVAELMAAMADVGRRVAAGIPKPSGTLPQRAQTVTDLLNHLGAVATVETKNGSTWISGVGCPLSAATSHHTEVCHAVRSLLDDLTDSDVTVHCRREVRPNCLFELRARNGNGNGNGDATLDAAARAQTSV